jgi:hypothetical protein
MPNLDTFPGVDECIVCNGTMRQATRGRLKRTCELLAPSIAKL